MPENLSIAVLPFRNMSSDPDNAYFCEGITEEIINALAKNKSLKVTSRTSSFYFKDKNVPVKEIAETLGVSLILEGSVRFSGRLMRITAKLVQAQEDFYFWSESWDRKAENSYALQDEISAIIAEKIRENSGHFEISTPDNLGNQPDAKAYEAVLLAKFHKNKWSVEDVKKAENYFREALNINPEYVDALVGLGDVYSFMAMTGIMPFEEGWTRSDQLCEQALASAPDNPEAFYLKANYAFFHSCDYSEAFYCGTKAVQLKPNYVEAQQFLSFLHVLAGKKAQAKEHLDIALGIDPLSQETLFFRAYFNYMSENFSLALEQLEECLEVNPKNIPAHAVKGLCLFKLGRYEELLTYSTTEPNLPEPEKIGSEALAYAGLDNKIKTAEYLKKLKEKAQAPDGFTFDSYLFLLYAVRGDKEAAFQWVEQGLKKKSTLLMLRYADPVVSSLRADKRYPVFHELIFKTKVPQVAAVTKKALLTEDEALAYRLKLLKHMQEVKPYTAGDLSLKSLALQTDIHPNRLSWLLNEKIGKSFNEFVNSYRIEFFLSLAQNPENAGLTLIGMAYDSGFNSKSVFNTYFKKEKGLSPKQYLSSKL